MNTTAFCFVIIVLLVCMLAYRVAEQSRRDKELQQAYQAYQDSLKTLKANPTNADLKQSTLMLGRQYSNLTRENKGTTVYDEMALMNDINAATAAAMVATQPAISQGSKQSVEDRLQSLKGLRDKGLIDDQEYNTRRMKILEEI